MTQQIVWTDKYDTGIEEVDNQHRQIVDYLNRLGEAKNSRNIKVVKDVIDGMVDYTLSHFAFEEALMQEAQYPFARAHKSVHETFIKRVEKFQERFKAGEDVAQEFYDVLKRWLVNHIQRDDAAYVRIVKPYLEPSAKETASAATTESEGSWISRAVKKFFRS